MQTDKNLLHVDPERLDIEMSLKTDPANQEISKSSINKIMDLSILLHPERLLIVSLLYNNHSIKRSDLRKILNLNSGQLQNQINKLQEVGIITLEFVFSEDKPKRFIFLTNTGYQVYRQFQETMITIFNRNPSN